ncbi:MAG: DinB family protein [Rhodothermales bacterium]
MKKSLTTLLLVAGVTLSAMAQNETAAQFQKEFMNTFNAAAEKIDGLARALPAEAYDWRPSEGVRSTKEAMMHVAAANYFIGSMLGTPVPEGVDARNLESSVKTKDEAIKHLNASFDFVRKAAGAVKPADLTKEMDLFGNKSTTMGAMYVISDHMSEHLGQLIAYARSNNVAPPWSR